MLGVYPEHLRKFIVKLPFKTDLEKKIKVFVFGKAYSKKKIECYYTAVVYSIKNMFLKYK